MGGFACEPEVCLEQNIELKVHSQTLATAHQQPRYSHEDKVLLCNEL